MESVMGAVRVGDADATHPFIPSTPHTYFSLPRRVWWVGLLLAGLPSLHSTLQAEKLAGKHSVIT